MKYVRVVTTKASIDKIAELTRVAEQSNLPALKTVPGFLGASLFIEPTTGEVLSLTYWASEKDALAYEQSGVYTRMMENLRPFFTIQPTLKTYQVLAEAPTPAAALR